MSRTGEEEPLAAPAPADRRAPWRRASGAAAVAWLLSHVCYAILTATAAFTTGPEDRVHPKGRLLHAWAGSWDGWHYLNIAADGYDTQHEQNAAFFPLYPMLIKLANYGLPGGGQAAALVIANVAGFGALLLLFRLTEEEFGAAVAARTVTYLVAFPAAFFLAAAYNESLFLLLVVSALYCIRREHWWAAGALGALASATRLAGVLLAVPFLLEFVRRHGWRGSVRPDALAVALVPVGLAAYMAYLWYEFGDPFRFVWAGRLFSREQAWPWEALWRTARRLPDYPLLNQHTLVQAVDLGIALLFMALLVLCVAGPWKFRRDQLYLVVFSALVLLLPLTAPATTGWSPLAGLPRYAIEVVSVFMLVARMGRDRLVDRGYLFLALTLQAVLVIRFVNGGWVA